MVIMARLAAIELRLAALEGATSNSGIGRVADTADLDGMHGNPRIKYGLKAKYWGEQPDPNIGRTWSQCSPDYLDAAAKYLDACAYMARKGGDEKKASYKDRDAARCRGWAARIRGGWQAPPEPASVFATPDSGSFGEAPAFGADASNDAFDFGANAKNEEDQPL